MMDRHQENELLRMTKNELIDHIFYLYKIYDFQFQELVRWYTASDEIVRLRDEMGLDKNVND